MYVWYVNRLFGMHKNCTCSFHVNEWESWLLHWALFFPKALPCVISVLKSWSRFQRKLNYSIIFCSQTRYSDFMCLAMCRRLALNAEPWPQWINRIEAHSLYKKYNRILQLPNHMRKQWVPGLSSGKGGTWERGYTIASCLDSTMVPYWKHEVICH